MMTIDKFNFAGKKAIVRVDFNVPLDENGKITDDTRIRGALPTLKKVLADGGSLIIMSHMGKPKGKVNAKYSLSQIVDAVSEKLGVPVQFAPDCAKAGDAAAALKPGEVLLLENLRFYPEEEGKPVDIDKEDPAYEDAKKAMKASQKEFAKTLASYADCYINDAFGTAHRKHASTAVIADYFDADNKMLGYLMEKEVQAVDNILKDIKRPFTAIMGGSKVSTKIGIIENLMDKVDNLILCGGMTYTFAKAQGGKIGNSIGANIKATDWLSIQARGNVDYVSDKFDNKMYASTAANIAEKNDETGLPNGRYVWSDEQNFQVYGDFMAMFNKTFSDFSINAALGTSINVSKANSLMISSDTCINQEIQSKSFVSKGIAPS
jgi:phosphoglycerate kinase